MKSKSEEKLALSLVIALGGFTYAAYYMGYHYTQDLIKQREERKQQEQQRHIPGDEKLEKIIEINGVQYHCSPGQKSSDLAK